MVIDGGLPLESLESQVSNACCHHWVIQPAVGPVSEGMCQKCGEVREFKNSIDYETEWSNRRDVVRSEIGVSTEPMDDVDEMAG